MEDHEGFPEDHEGFPEDAGIGLSTEKRAYSKAKEMFNEVLVEVGENPSLLKELCDRFQEHVAKPMFEKIALLNAAENGVGNVVGRISSLSSVNKGLPPQAGRYLPSWEIGLEKHTSRRQAKRRGTEREDEEEHELESEIKNK